METAAEKISDILEAALIEAGYSVKTAGSASSMSRYCIVEVDTEDGWYEVTIRISDHAARRGAVSKSHFDIAISDGPRANWSCDAVVWDQDGDELIYAEKAVALAVSEMPKLIAQVADEW